jgi:hypothetical protein
VTAREKKDALVRAERPSDRTKRRKRDQQVRRVVQRFAILADLRELRYRPALASLAKVTLLAERCYEHLRDRKSLLNEKGELAPSIDTFRRLIDSQAGMLDMIGLTPRAAREMRTWADRELDLVGQLAAKSVSSNADSKSE